MLEGETIGSRVAMSVEAGVAEGRLDRPDKLNALDPAMFVALIEAGERLIPRKDLRAVVLHGAGRGFCAGLDMQSFAAMAMGRSDGLLADLIQRTHGAADAPQRAALVWRELPVPVIAAIYGVAFQIALGADVRYVAPDARLSPGDRDEVRCHPRRRRNHKGGARAIGPGRPGRSPATRSPRRS